MQPGNNIISIEYYKYKVLPTYIVDPLNNYTKLLIDKGLYPKEYNKEYIELSAQNVPWREI